MICDMTPAPGAAVYSRAVQILLERSAHGFLLCRGPDAPNMPNVTLAAAGERLTKACEARLDSLVRASLPTVRNQQRKLKSLVLRKIPCDGTFGRGSPKDDPWLISRFRQS